MRFQGLDRPKCYWTVSQRDESCREVQYVAQQWDVEEYLWGLGPKDVVWIAASTVSLHWVERIAARGTRCVMLDPTGFAPSAAAGKRSTGVTW
jgi:hypothetical protein